MNWGAGRRTILAASSIAFAALTAWSMETSAQSKIGDDFRTGALDWAAWCPCQIDTAESPLKFSADPDEQGDRIVSIVADEASLGGNVCRPKEPHFECRPPADTPAFAM